MKRFLQKNWQKVAALTEPSESSIYQQQQTTKLDAPKLTSSYESTFPKGTPPQKLDIIKAHKELKSNDFSRPTNLEHIEAAAKTKLPVLEDISKPLDQPNEFLQGKEQTEAVSSQPHRNHSSNIQTKKELPTNKGEYINYGSTALRPTSTLEEPTPISHHPKTSAISHSPVTETANSPAPSATINPPTANQDTSTVNSITEAPEAQPDIAATKHSIEVPAKSEISGDSLDVNAAVSKLASIPVSSSPNKAPTSPRKTPEFPSIAQDINMSNTETIAEKSPSTSTEPVVSTSNLSAKSENPVKNDAPDTSLELSANISKLRQQMQEMTLPVESKRSQELSLIPAGQAPNKPKGGTSDTSPKDTSLALSSSIVKLRERMQETSEPATQIHSETTKRTSNEHQRLKSSAPKLSKLLEATKNASTRTVAKRSSPTSAENTLHKPPKTISNTSPKSNIREINVAPETSVSLNSSISKLRQRMQESAKPVTAKVSKKLSPTLGDQVISEASETTPNTPVELNSSLSKFEDLLAVKNNAKEQAPEILNPTPAVVNHNPISNTKQEDIASTLKIANEAISPKNHVDLNDSLAKLKNLLNTRKPKVIEPSQTKTDQIKPKVVKQKDQAQGLVVSRLMNVMKARNQQGNKESASTKIFTKPKKRKELAPRLKDKPAGPTLTGSDTGPDLSAQVSNIMGKLRSESKPQVKSYYKSWSEDSGEAASTLSPPVTKPPKDALTLLRMIRQGHQKSKKPHLERGADAFAKARNVTTKDIDSLFRDIKNSSKQASNLRRAPSTTKAGGKMNANLKNSVLRKRGAIQEPNMPRSPWEKIQLPWVNPGGEHLTRLKTFEVGSTDIDDDLVAGLKDKYEAIQVISSQYKMNYANITTAFKPRESVGDNLGFFLYEASTGDTKISPHEEVDLNDILFINREVRKSLSRVKKERNFKVLYPQAQALVDKVLTTMRDTGEVNKSRRSHMQENASNDSAKSKRGGPAKKFTNSKKAGEAFVKEVPEIERNRRDNNPSFDQFFEEMGTMDADEEIQPIAKPKKKSKVREISAAPMYDRFTPAEIQKLELKTFDEKKATLTEKGLKRVDIQSRSPVVAVMGHVDHGKTTLLDTLRKRDEENSTPSVADQEAGGITQRVSGFRVNMVQNAENTKADQSVVFVDTPGHELFSSMRLSGTLVADIVVLCVSVTDSLQPQTLESLELASKHKIPVVVAMTKLDLLKIGLNEDSAEINKYKDALFNEIATYIPQDLLIDVVPISCLAKPNPYGLDSLIETLLLQAEVMELTAPRKYRGEAVLLESYLDPILGPVGELILKQGTLKVGDIAVCGEVYGKIRSIIPTSASGTSKDTRGVASALPSDPIRITGLDFNTSGAIDSRLLIVVKTQRHAKRIVKMRQLIRLDHTHDTTPYFEDNSEQLEQLELGALHLTDGSLIHNFEDELPIEIPLIFKVDTLNSLDSVEYLLEGLNTELEKASEEYHKKFKPLFESLKANPILVGNRVAMQELRESRVKNSVLPLGSKYKIIKKGAGDIGEADIELAKMFDTCKLIGFNVKNKAGQSDLIFSSDVIYNILDELKAMPKSFVKPITKIEVIATVNVKQIFILHNGTVVAGSEVKSGVLDANSKFRLVRGENILLEAECLGGVYIGNKKAQKVRQGVECGVNYKSWDPQVGDIIETYSTSQS